jgi:hypothetical protein
VQRLISKNIGNLQKIDAENDESLEQAFVKRKVTTLFDYKMLYKRRKNIDISDVKKDTLYQQSF